MAWKGPFHWRSKVISKLCNEFPLNSSSAASIKHRKRLNNLGITNTLKLIWHEELLSNSFMWNFHRLLVLDDDDDNVKMHFHEQFDLINFSTIKTTSWLDKNRFSLTHILVRWVVQWKTFIVQKRVKNKSKKKKKRESFHSFPRHHHIDGNKVSQTHKLSSSIII